MMDLEDRLRALGRDATSADAHSADAVMRRRNSLRQRRTLTHVIAPIAAAAVVATAIVIPVIGSKPISSTEASQFLIQVGDRAGAQSDLGARTAKYWYVKTQSATAGCPVKTREIWLGHNRKGVVRQEFTDGLHNEPIPAGESSPWVSWDELWQLPTDADALYDWVYEAAGDKGQDKDSEMWTVVWDLLRESPAPPALRQALYDLAARIPGVSMTGESVDALGRAGVEIERVGRWGVESYLVDPSNGVILERRGLLNADGVSIESRSTFVVRQTLDSIPAYALPVNDPPHDNQATTGELGCTTGTAVRVDASPSPIPTVG